jgi:leader peptidase (prepilin peptidase)/N-methyltransferase
MIELLVALSIIWGLMCIYDIKYMKVPKVLCWSSLFLSLLIYITFTPPLINWIIILICIIFVVITARPLRMGKADVLLLGSMALLYKEWVLPIYILSILCALVGSKITKNRELPFIPYIVLSAIIISYLQYMVIL